MHCTVSQDKLIQRLARSLSSPLRPGVGNRQPECGEAKARSPKRWHGQYDVATKVGDIGVRELTSRFRRTCKAEESFRVKQHDRRVRPVFDYDQSARPCPPGQLVMALAHVCDLAMTISGASETASADTDHSRGTHDWEDAPPHDPRNDMNQDIPLKPGLKVIGSDHGRNPSACPMNWPGIHLSLNVVSALKHADPE